MEDRDGAEVIARLARDMRKAFGRRAEDVAARMATESAPHDSEIAEIWIRIGAAIRGAGRP